MKAFSFQKTLAALLVLFKNVNEFLSAFSVSGIYFVYSIMIKIKIIIIIIIGIRNSCCYNDSKGLHAGICANPQKGV